MATKVASADPRFKEVHETISAIMKYPGDRLATFTASFGGAARARYEVIGSKGSLSLENAYEYADGMTMEIRDVSGKAKKKEYKKLGEGHAQEELRHCFAMYYGAGIQS